MGDVQLSQPLHERVYEKIRDSIGDLLTDDDLKILVNKAADKAFFEPTRQNIGSATWPNWQEGPPAIVKEIETLLKPMVIEAVDAYLKEHKEEISELLNEALGKGFTGIVSNYLDSRLRNVVGDVENRFIAVMNR